MLFKVRWPEVKVISTATGAEAAHLVESESPDVVILDLSLPDIDGIEVLKEIRQFSDVPTVVLTARARSASLQSKECPAACCPSGGHGACYLR